jgi:glycosyltransferase involved in cell wall biosynthesis
MIFLNAETFLEEAITSVLAQTYTHWELLLVDDGSADTSTQIAQRFALRHSERIHYLQHAGHENRGMSAARNLGLRHSGGEFIAFLDADDVWLPPKLEYQVAVLRQHPEAQMAYGPTRLWYSWTDNPQAAKRDGWRKTGIRGEQVIDPPELLLRFLRGRAQTPATCSVLIRREAVEAVGGFEESFRGLYEDQAFFAKIFLTTPAFVSRKSWDLYRQHPNSCCIAAAGTGDFHPELPHPAKHAFLKWFETYLSGQVGADSKVRSTLRRQLWLYDHARLHRLLSRIRNLPDRVKRFMWEGFVPLAFQGGRLILPASVRQRIWTRWLSSRF